MIASAEDGHATTLKANALEAHGFVNQAEQVLSDAEKKYESTTAAGYLLAARARMFMTLRDGDSARRVLEKLRSLSSGDGTVGTALLALFLAELAYNEQKYHVTAVGLFDSVRERWPELLASHSSALFRAGELLHALRAHWRRTGRLSCLLERPNSEPCESRIMSRLRNSPKS